jgi:hypothetical protein
MTPRAPREYNVGVRMRAPVVAVLLIASVLVASPVRAQEPPPRIPWFVIDAQANIPRFPSDDQQLADSRGMTLAELPGAGLGAQVGLHIYPLKFKVVTFGFGISVIGARSRQSPSQDTIDAAIASGATVPRSSSETFTAYAPQLSFNFGNGHGWSYISGGLGQSNWALVPAGQEGFPPDSEPLKTLNYGGGARWFMKQHVGFSFDVRFYAISPTTQVSLSFPPQPRMTQLVISAGVSLK